MAQILDGRLLSSKIKSSLKERISKYKHAPCLAAVLVGDDPGSSVYVKNKIKACEEVGIKHYLKHLPTNVSADQLLQNIEHFNENDSYHGILVQLPLPSHIDQKKIISCISPHKDVDCFHPTNLGLLMTGQHRFLPCTPAGILELLKYYSIVVKGKNVVIVNNTIVVGQPLASLLTQDTEFGNATVTVCHNYTSNLKKICSEADIIITAVGKSSYRLTADMVKDGAIIIDVGIFRQNGIIRGDSEYEEVSKKASWITPVPGGVGPMTVAMLLSNTCLATEK